MNLDGSPVVIGQRDPQAVRAITWFVTRCTAFAVWPLTAAAVVLWDAPAVLLALPFALFTLGNHSSPRRAPWHSFRGSKDTALAARVLEVPAKQAIIAYRALFGLSMAAVFGVVFAGVTTL